MEEVFKVVCRSRWGQTYQQLVSYGAEGESLVVVYEPGVVTYPKLEGSKLFAFSNKDDAVFYMENSAKNYLCEVWRCEAGETEWITHLATIPTYEYAAKYWADTLEPDWKLPAPKGTVCVPWLKLIERVA